jgi:mannose-1-phosphate guanylyltransferase/mannose-6-phosphate isomerase
MYSVILCGGSGTRLWPLSRKNFPKQFLALYSDQSLLQETFLRMRALMSAEHIFFVTNQENHFNVFNQIKELEKNYQEKNIIAEPESKNTAPAIALAVKYLLEKEKISLDEPIIFVPADHYISKREDYVALVKRAAENVGHHVATIGMTPAKPETGFGYIRKGANLKGYNLVLEFKEKPDRQTAEKYLESGEYVWNAGMYLFSGRTFVRELHRYAPEIYKLFTLPYAQFIGHFSEMPAVAIDVAVSEKSKNLIVFEGDFGWSDIGSFDALAEVAGANGKNNPRHVSVDSQNVFVHSDKLVATLGVNDLIVVENNDSILIQKKGRSEDVKKVVEELKIRKSKELEHNLLVHRPWGKYEVLIENPEHKVRKITVYPGAQLGLHAHHHRAEHWIVVKGTALVRVGEKELTLNENESTFIPKSTRHRLENPGKINLEMIEVQTGGYLEEDDILRFEDQ